MLCCVTYFVLIFSGTSPLACLNAMLHTNSRGEEGMFYKVPGRMGVYTLKKDVADVVKELSDCSEDSSEAQSDSQGSEHSTSSSSSTSTASNKDRRRSCWKRKVTSRVSQPSSPQPSCPSPPIPAGKVISPSQKLSKKALKQALKQQQQRKKQQRRAVMPVPTSQHLLLKTVKSTSNIATAKPAPPQTWASKRSEVQPRTHQISAPDAKLAVKSNESLEGLGNKDLQRSSRLRDRHLKRTKCAEIDVETPDSILVNTNLRALINKHTFSLLPADCQQRLLRLLPEVDRPVGSDGLLKLNSSALNNEFFTSASQSWKERLAEGEFTPEMQLRIRQEIEKEKKVEMWKEQFYESYYGENSGLTMEEFSDMTAEDNDIKGEIFPPVEHMMAKPADVEGKAPEDSLIVKTEKDRECLLKSNLSEGTEAIPQVDNTDISTVLNANSTKDSEMAKENKPDSVVETTTQTMYTDCESILAEPISHTCVTPNKPKSPNVVQLSRTPANIGDLPQDSSEASTPEKTPEKSEASLTSGAKRRLNVSESSLASPEKSPRLMTPSQSPQPFRALCKPPKETAQQSPEQKVPPLKIPMSWINPKPFLISQVSHRAPFPASNNSPGRTGARTLADIKAKAQLAREKRAAAAAAHGGSIPGPGPGGGPVPGGGPGGGIDENKRRILDLGSTGSGRSERGTSAPPPASKNQGEVKAAGQTSTHSATGAQLLQKPCVQPRVSNTTSSGSSRTFQTTDTSVTIKNQNTLSITADKFTKIHGASGLGTLAHHFEHIKADCSKGMVTDGSNLKMPASKLSKPSQSASLAAPAHFISNPSSMLRTSITAQGNDNTINKRSPDIVLRSVRLATSGPSTRSSSSIPANNPLVTQLLQGKNVPLDQILPRPSAKVEMKTVSLPSADKPPSASTVKAVDSCRKEDLEKTSHTAAQQLERFMCHNRQNPSGQRIFELFSGKNLSSSSNSSTQASVASIVNQEQILQTLVKKVWQEKVNAPSPPEMNDSISQSFMLGFVGRRASKPAMSGHYLLNLSTYGRAPEPFRRIHLGSGEVDTSFNDPDHLENAGDETESITESGEEGTESEENTSEWATSTVLVKSDNRVSLKSENPCGINSNAEQFQTQDLKGKVTNVTKSNIYSDANIARNLAKMANVLSVRLKKNTSDICGMHTTSVEPQHHHTEMVQMSRTNGNSAGLLGSSFGGTINISTSPEGLQRSSVPTGGDFTSSNADNIVSFSVTLTTIPSNNTINSSCPDQPISVQAYTNESGMELSPSKCYCRLKAMIMCKGCGAFCHDDCIGPSKLCVSCLVVR
ncbi:putative Polycomb group protein ASXL2 isoform X2 [Pyxicephalus adspersus]|uniref:putative Polycomb group protein ASXL2 isoform X2 n=1 Tax=Pyxicephalus adspersus TaxID=30357 RepID=UPI003B5CD1A9